MGQIDPMRTLQSLPIWHADDPAYQLICGPYLIEISRIRSVQLSALFSVGVSAATAEPKVLGLYRRWSDRRRLVLLWVCFSLPQLVGERMPVCSHLDEGAAIPIVGQFG
jgi:hypothetical protein